MPVAAQRPAAQVIHAAPADGGKLIVITAPLTEAVDHAGYFIQMSMASLPMWLEGILNRKYPNWQDVPYNPDGSARSMPAGARVVEASLLRYYRPDEIACCYPQDLDKFIGPKTRAIAVSTHNPLGVTFAAGVYASLLGASGGPINSHYAKALFDTIKASPFRKAFKVIVGGSGGWQLLQTGSCGPLGVDCVVEGRAESEGVTELFAKAIRGDELPRELTVAHPKDRDAFLCPDKRTTFGVVEMTTGCGRRCRFCLPDLNPQLDLPKERILQAVRANVRDGNPQISLATEDMFIWGQLGTGVPFYFPNREALLDLFSDVVNTPGVEQHVLSHLTMAPAVVDPLLVRKLTEIIIDKSPIRLPYLSTHPEHKALTPLVGLETGSIRMARQLMPGKAAPFPIDEWPSVFIRGLEVMNQNNWFPAATLMVGCPGETDEDVRETLDLVYEVERRGLFAFFIPSVFTPLHDTRMQDAVGVRENRQLTALQWQLIMKCWKMNLRPGQASWWAPAVWRVGALGLWAFRLRGTNGPNFTWPLLMFASAAPERLMGRLGRIHIGRPLAVKTRKDLLAAIKPHQQRFLREDNGDLPGLNGRGLTA